MEQENLKQLIKDFIENEKYDSIKKLFYDSTDRSRYTHVLYEVGIDLIHDVCLKHLTDSNYNNNNSLYTCAEELLKLIAHYGPSEEVLLELLELIEDQNTEHHFTSALRALQVVLLRLKDRKPQALDWSLNAIVNRLISLQIPEYLSKGYDSDQQRLLEQDEKIQNLLIHYVTVNLFYTPLLSDILNSSSEECDIFRNCGLTRRNVICCFLVQLLGKPLALLDITRHGETYESHASKYVAEVTNNITKCIINPLFFFYIMQRRSKWQCAKQYDITTNLFSSQEKLPLDALSVYVYMVLVEEITYDNIPQVYDCIYVFETGLIFVIELMEQDESALQGLGIRLALKLLHHLSTILLPYECLEIEVHQTFCDILCKIISYSCQIDLRKESVRLLRQYILQFEDKGRYYIIKNLLCRTGYTSISGYLCIVYKDIVAEKLILDDNENMPIEYCGYHFRDIFLDYICKLPFGTETDLIECADFIISGLNIIRFFSIKDRKNRTGFWNITDTVKNIYLKHLRSGINMTVAHIKAELKTVCGGEIKENDQKQNELPNIASVSILNCSSTDSLHSSSHHNQSSALLEKNLCTLDLIKSLLARVEECLS